MSNYHILILELNLVNRQKGKRRKFSHSVTLQECHQDFTAIQNEMKEYPQLNNKSQHTGSHFNRSEFNSLIKGS